MKLSEKQQRFSRMLGLLLHYVETLPGYGVTMGEAYRPNPTFKKSLHKKRLATDLNLFIDGVYQTSTEAHEPLGIFWESIGGSWGGRFKKKDGNHYSLGHGGVR